MEDGSRRAETEENELVSPKEYFANNFPYNETFCLDCQKFIANIYSAEYHVKRPSRKKILEGLYDPSVIRSKTLQIIMFLLKNQGVLSLQKED